MVVKAVSRSHSRTDFMPQELTSSKCCLQPQTAYFRLPVEFTCRLKVLPHSPQTSLFDPLRLPEKLLRHRPYADQLPPTVIFRDAFSKVFIGCRNGVDSPAFWTAEESVLNVAVPRCLRHDTIRRKAAFIAFDLHRLLLFSGTKIPHRHLADRVFDNIPIIRQLQISVWDFWASQGLCTLSSQMRSKAAQLQT